MSPHLCECGCGQPTPLAPRTSRRRGQVRGQALRFIHGHNARSSGERDYPTVMVNRQQRKVHRLRAERALGKPLPKTARVHHLDGSKRGDAPLVICQDHAYHLLLHVRMRVKAAGGNPNTDALCGICRRAKPFAAFAQSKGRRYDLSPNCRQCEREQWQHRRQKNNAVESLL